MACESGAQPDSDLRERGSLDQVRPPKILCLCPRLREFMCCQCCRYITDPGLLVGPGMGLYQALPCYMRKYHHAVNRHSGKTQESLSIAGPGPPVLSCRDAASYLQLQRIYIQAVL
jgi:hypothetical protein